MVENAIFVHDQYVTFQHVFSAYGDEDYLECKSQNHTLDIYIYQEFFHENVLHGI